MRLDHITSSSLLEGSCDGVDFITHVNATRHVKKRPDFKSFPDGNSEREPPDPFSNSEVKTLCADGSFACCDARVGHRQGPNRKAPGSKESGVFSLVLCAVARRALPADAVVFAVIAGGAPQAAVFGVDHDGVDRSCGAT